jgi:hypothetical protein
MHMTSTLTAPQPSTAKHGSVTYYDDPGLAAQQASIDMAAYAAKAATPTSKMADGDTAEIAAAGITAPANWAPRSAPWSAAAHR